MNSYDYLYSELVNKLRIEFCCNPNEVIITPGRLFNMTNFIVKNIPEKYKVSDSFILDICKNTLNELIKCYPENISDIDNVNCFINVLLPDYLNATLYDGKN